MSCISFICDKPSYFFHYETCFKGYFYLYEITKVRVCACGDRDMFVLFFKKRKLEKSHPIWTILHTVLWSIFQSLILKSDAQTSTILLHSIRLLNIRTPVLSARSGRKMYWGSQSLSIPLLTFVLLGSIKTVKNEWEELINFCGGEVSLCIHLSLINQHFVSEGPSLNA